VVEGVVAIGGLGEGGGPGAGLAPPWVLSS